MSNARPNIFTVKVLRPKPECMDQFMPLWNARLELEAQRGDDQPADLEDRINELSAQMLPFQYEAKRAEAPNLVTNVGRNDILDKYFRGSGYTQTIRFGLKGAGSAAAGDTQASHAGWLEQGGANAPTYSGNRPSVTMNAASSQSSVSPSTNFSITGTGTVAGIFVNNGGSATKDDTTGVLLSAADFSGGTEAVNNLDTLSVTYTFNG